MSKTIEFDYLIVGAGSAGCVLANRLSADGKNSVLVLEASPKDINIWIHVPLGYGRLFKNKNVNWMYQTEPEPGLDRRTIFQPRCKVLGGSSSINGLLHVHFLPFSTDKMGEKLHSFSGFSASVCQLRPESRGSLRIRSADPTVPPEIRINYLTTEVDRSANVEGLKILRKILRAPALSSYVIEEVDPGAKVSTDEELLNYCRRRGSTIYHPTSTCRMGSDALAVVDQRLRVRGIEGVRVVDGSIMPDLVSGNTNAAIIMVAEKASDMILEDVR
jgi:choline dehydrogenase-like flavoprotein